MKIYVHHAGMMPGNKIYLPIIFELTPEEKKNKYFWLAMWRLDKKITGEVLLWIIMNAMNGTEVIAMKQKYFDNNYQRK
jgi:hypothetical protein